MDHKTLEAVTKHGEQLKAIFRLPTEVDPVALCRRVRRIEREAHDLTTRDCNGQVSVDVREATEATLLKRLDSLLGFEARRVPVFVNGDCRGYALKIDDEWMRAHPEFRLHQDWGGYGIIAPDLTGGEK